MKLSLVIKPDKVDPKAQAISMILNENNNKTFVNLTNPAAVLLYKPKIYYPVSYLDPYPFLDRYSFLVTPKGNKNL